MILQVLRFKLVFQASKDISGNFTRVLQQNVLW